MLARLLGRVRLVGRGFAAADDLPSRLKLASALLVAPLLHLTGPIERPITVRLGGACVTFALNRGDLNSLREVFLDQVYRLPLSGRFETLVDLGANIGLTSVFSARAYGVRQVVAVEPDPRNLALLRRNLAQNGLEATILEAAVAKADGSGIFRADPAANLGKLVASGAPHGANVRTVALSSVFEAVTAAGGRPDLLKVDVEGAEFEIFDTDAPLPTAVAVVFIEMHEGGERRSRLMARLSACGFAFVPADSCGWAHVDAFVRPGRLNVAA